MVLPLALSFLQNLAVVLFVLICVAIILIVLLQKGRGGGIGAAFGGGGAGSLLGTKTGDFLTWVTICLVALFLVLSVLMGKFMRPSEAIDFTPALTAPPATAPAADDASVPAAAEEAAEAVVPVVEEAAAQAEAATTEAVEVVEETADEMN